MQSLWERWKRNLGLWSCINSRLDLPAWSSLQMSSLGLDRRRHNSLCACCYCWSLQTLPLAAAGATQTSPTAALGRSRAQHPSDVSTTRQEVTFTWGFQCETSAPASLALVSGCLQVPALADKSGPGSNPSWPADGPGWPWLGCGGCDPQAPVGHLVCRVSSVLCMIFLPPLKNAWNYGRAVSRPISILFATRSWGYILNGECRAGLLEVTEGSKVGWDGTGGVCTAEGAKPAPVSIPASFWEWSLDQPSLNLGKKWTCLQLDHWGSPGQRWRSSMQMTASTVFELVSCPSFI